METTLSDCSVTGGGGEVVVGLVRCGATDGGMLAMGAGANVVAGGWVVVVDRSTCSPRTRVRGRTLPREATSRMPRAVRPHTPATRMPTRRRTPARVRPERVYGLAHASRWRNVSHAPAAS